MSKDPDQEELDELIEMLVPEQVRKPVLTPQQGQWKDVFYCFSCIGECDPDKHQDMKRYHSGPARFSWTFDITFRPRVILARGDLDDVQLKSFCVGHEQQLAAGDVPMRYFKCPFEFPALAKLVKSGLRPDDFSMNLTFCTIPVGVPLTFEFSSHVTDFGLWGCVAAVSPRRKRSKQ
jgi:hypothetical protein